MKGKSKKKHPHFLLSPFSWVLDNRNSTKTFVTPVYDKRRNETVKKEGRMTDDKKITATIRRAPERGFRMLMMKYREPVSGNWIP